MRVEVQRATKNSPLGADDGYSTGLSSVINLPLRQKAGLPSNIDMAARAEVRPAEIPSSIDETQ